jgi:ClpP class serine protease
MLLYLINQTGGIPIKVETSTQTNWSQFIISLLFGSIFLLWVFGGIFATSVKNILMKLYFIAVSARTGRHIIFIKHTEQGLFGGSMINQNTLNKIQRAMIKFNGKPFDLVLHTPGGEIFAALFISRLLKEYPGQVRAIIPMYAMSGGTLLALSTDEIHMSSTACMGPVDPQLGSLFKFGSASAWDHIVKYKGKKADDQSISFAMMGKQYTKTIQLHLDNVMHLNMDSKLKKRFIEFITTGGIEHAFALTPRELQKMGLPIKFIEEKDILIKLMKYIVKSGNEGVTYA